MYFTVRKEIHQGSHVTMETRACFLLSVELKRPKEIAGLRCKVCMEIIQAINLKLCNYIKFNDYIKDNKIKYVKLD
jgi:hypothetical protein